MVRIKNINGKEIKIPWKNKKSNRKPNHEIEETWTHEKIRIDLKQMTHRMEKTNIAIKKAYKIRPSLKIKVHL
jgi:hypothetical protein